MNLNKINQLRGVDFVWKESDEKSMGVIAQELQKVFPGLVTKENDELSVNYNGLIAVLIESVKEFSKDKDWGGIFINKKVMANTQRENENGNSN